MGVRVVHDIDDLYNDLVAIGNRVRPEMRDVVRDCIKEGNKIAKANAKRTAGDHGKYYPRTFTTSMNRGLGLFGNTISGEYGPDASIVVQGKKGSLNPGRMSFERGSRNSPPHNDLAKSADVIGAKFELRVNLRVNGWFW